MLLDFLVLAEAVLIILFIVELIFYLKKRKLAQYLDTREFSRKQLKSLYTLLKHFNRSFGEYYSVSKELKTQFKEIMITFKPNRNDKSADIEKELSHLRTIGVDKGAISKIEELLYLKTAQEQQKAYYERERRKANRTKQDIASKSYEKVFPVLYSSRMHFLSSIDSVSNKMVSQCNENIEKIEKSITELKKIREKSIWEKGAKIGFSILTAPFRHAGNIIEGLETGDSQKAMKGAAMIGAGLFGFGIIADALDVFEGAEEAMAAGDLSGKTWVDEHLREYEPGEFTVVDGHWRNL